MFKKIINRMFGRHPAHRGGGRSVTLPKRVRASDAFDTTHDLLASFDSAKTTDDNSRHWANADTLSASAAASPEIRRTLRSRARYEAQENNSYAKGIVLTLANDTIGVGPRLQMQTADEAANAMVERKFMAWCKRVKLSAKLRTMTKSRVVDGEAFAWLVTNERIPGRVKLDVRLVEADQVSTPNLMGGSPNAIDGIVYDRAGNPVEYHVLKNHPGDNAWLANEFDHVDAGLMIHLFREDRPGQRRGLPEIAPALPLFAQLRRMTLATIAAAETAADFSAVMYTDSSAIESPADVDQGQVIDLERRAMLTLPAGWKLGQIAAEHPNSTYDMFTSRILNEIARCLNMPYNVAAGNSSSYNYSSGRLDHQTYFRALEVDRNQFELDVLDRIFAAWLDEAILAGELEGLPVMEEDATHRWFWPGLKHVDPLLEANAATTLKAAGLLTDDEYLYAEGIDPEEHYAQLAAQIARRKDVGQGDADLQATALNGAQITSLQGIMELVIDGRLDAEPAKAAVSAAFPTLNGKQVAAIFDQIKVVKPEPAPAGPAGNPPQNVNKQPDPAATAA